ncbi:L,D-transpeptidase family protein [Paenibacillus thalictri]|uniref:L,D-TPase catalytic domain-containing protein n=1 Tax=Paenibacillus thalictri TaxID=2527873 RepID=A0A4Q9DQH8_9BACL|nr:L,D-transpeptidase family protein [Paenibacillus thalictri]TBL77843.1 hypothetical protein EYB31_17045 [Paenibacillus thalictri]
MEEKQPASTQLVLVEVPEAPSFHGTLQVVELEEGKWRQTLAAIPVVIGRSGLAASGDDKAEGDGKTPSGQYALGPAFGTKPPPAGIKLPYRLVGEDDYWVDDPTSDDYNRWVHYTGDPYTRWKSFELLANPLYPHAVIVQYNEQPVVPGKGSAIFIHQWKNENSPTQGCVAMSYDNLVRLIATLDPAKHPSIRIVQQNK